MIKCFTFGGFFHRLFFLCLTFSLAKLHIKLENTKFLLKISVRKVVRQLRTLSTCLSYWQYVHDVLRVRTLRTDLRAMRRMMKCLGWYVEMTWAQILIHLIYIYNSTFAS